MFLIAHRGLLDGPDAIKENHPDTIVSSISKGFDVEIDLNFIDNKAVLGHDRPQYEVTKEFLKNKKLWIHTKTIDALLYCIEQLSDTNYFYHEHDPCVITSHGWIWTHPTTQYLTNKSVAVIPETVMSIDQVKLIRCAGICSDYVNKLRADIL